MLSFSVIIVYSAIEIGPYSPYRKKVISALKLNKKKLLGPVLVSEKTTNICLSQAKRYYFVYAVYVHALVRAR